MARLLHRTHLLCLLSRGLLFDQAAGDPLLQVIRMGCKAPCYLAMWARSCTCNIIHLLCFSSISPSHIARCLRARHNPSQGVTTITDQAIWQVVSSMGFVLSMWSRLCQDRSANPLASSTQIQPPTFDANSCAFLQATMLSVTDPATLPSVDSTGGVTPTALQPLLAWFHRTFHQLPGPAQTSPADDDDDLTGAANGVETVVMQLQGAAAARAGTAEELQALFVALCRAQSLLVRSVRCATALTGCRPEQLASMYSGAEHMKQQSGSIQHRQSLVQW